MLPPVLERLPQVKAVRSFFEPDGSSQKSKPNPLLPGEPRVHHAGRRSRTAPTSASRSTETPTAASSWTTPGAFVPGDFVTALLAEAVLESASPGRRSSTTCARAGPWQRLVERGGGDAAREPRRPRVHQAPHARGERRLRRRGLRALLLPRLLAGGLGRRPVPAHARASSRSKGKKLSEILRPFRERYFITGELNTPVADVPLKLQELEERFGARGGRFPTSTASPWTATAGTSTSGGRRTPSRCSASTWRRARRSHGAKARRGARADSRRRLEPG